MSESSIPQTLYAKKLGNVDKSITVNTDRYNNHIYLIFTNKTSLLRDMFVNRPSPLNLPNLFMHHRSLYFAAAAMETTMKATKTPTIPKNQLNPLVSCPGTTTFIPNIPVTR